MPTATASMTQDRDARLQVELRTELAGSIAHHHDDLRQRARQLVGREAADDLVQSTVEKALRNLHAFQPETNMLAWLRRIMSNLMIDEWRRQRRRTLACLGDVEARPTASGNAAEPPPQAPWEQLTLEDVLRVMPRLSRHVRPVFALHLEGLSFRGSPTASTCAPTPLAPGCSGPASSCVAC